MRIVGTYTRTGDAVHLHPCPDTGDAEPWRCGDGLALHEAVADVARPPRLRLCGSCWAHQAYEYAAQVHGGER